MDKDWKVLALRVDCGIFNLPLWPIDSRCAADGRI